MGTLSCHAPATTVVHDNFVAPNRRGEELEAETGGRVAAGPPAPVAAGQPHRTCGTERAAGDGGRLEPRGHDVDAADAQALRGQFVALGSVSRARRVRRAREPFGQPLAKLHWAKENENGGQICPHLKLNLLRASLNFQREIRFGIFGIV